MAKLVYLAFLTSHAWRKLSLSAWNSIRVETPPNTLRKLSTPSLRHLTMDFSCEDQHSESPDDFGEAQITWMQDFASSMKLHYPSTKLKIVVIEFNPDVHPHWFCRGDSDSSSWPWKRLEQAKQKPLNRD